MPKAIVLDLSHHNTIPKDLTGAHDAGIQAIIHKATESAGYVDEKAKARKFLTQDAGMLWGVYHFLRPRSIERQADHFTSQKDLIDDDTLLVCDFEVAGISIQDVLTFMRRVEKTTGQQPVLYTGHTLKDMGGATPELAKYRLWIAQYNNTGPTLPKGYKNWWLWQYSDKGSVPGINGNVDVNTYQGPDLKNDWVIKTGDVCNDG
jgi:lysozyme